MVFPRDYRISSRIGLDGNHLLCGQLRQMLTVAASLTALCVAICHVVSRRADEKMCWIATGFVVAAMAYKHTGWYLSIVGMFPDKPVCAESFLAFADLSISEICATSPWPTFILGTLVNAGKQSFMECRDFLENHAFILPLEAIFKAQIGQ